MQNFSWKWWEWVKHAKQIYGRNDYGKILSLISNVSKQTMRKKNDETLFTSCEK